MANLSISGWPIVELKGSKDDEDKNVVVLFATCDYGFIGADRMGKPVFLSLKDMRDNVKEVHQPAIQTQEQREAAMKKQQEEARRRIVAAGGPVPPGLLHRKPRRKR